MTGHHTILSVERERQLVELVQSGDRGALGELLGAYHKRVYHLCLRMVTNPDDAAELTQEVLLRAVQHVDGFRGGAKFSTWLLRIAMNLTVSHLRRRKVRSAVSLDLETERGDQAAAPLRSMIASEREPKPTESVEKKEQAVELAAALEVIDPVLRSVLLLRDVQQMDYQQIADVMSLPIGTVKSRLFRARLALRQALEGRAEPGTKSQTTEVVDG
jgi:RNA polymerase sigma-70 factor (ECF subfamily)